MIIPAGAFNLTHATVKGTTPGTKHPQPTPTPGLTRTAPPAKTPTATPSPTSTPAAASTPSPTPTVTVTPTVTATPQPSPTPGSSSGGVSGPLTLVISQQHGHFAGEANELGQYQLQLVTAQNQQVSGVTLAQPITIDYYYQPAEMTALDLDPGPHLA